MDDVKRRVLLIAHGSREEDEGGAAPRIARDLRERGYDADFAYKGYLPPKVGDILERYAEQGVKEFDAVPLFIAPGHYSDKVVPKRLGLPEGCRSGVIDFHGSEMSVRLTPPFGTSRHMPLFLDRLLAGRGCRREDAIILIGHGSKDGQNTAMLRFNSDALRGMGWDNVLIAHNEENAPSVEDALRAAGDRRIMAVPMFVSKGIHTSEDIPSKLGVPCGEEVPGKDAARVRCTRPVGLEEGISDVICALLEAL